MRKKSMLKKLLSGVLAAALAATALVSAPISAGAVSGEDQSFEDLDQYEIVEAMSPAWNVGNQLEASNSGTPSETAWVSTKITRELIHAVKEQGFKGVRIPVSYLSKIGSGPNYTIDSSWLKRIKEVVDYCMEEDMYAIINMHGDGYYTVTGGWLLCGAENQTEIKAKYQACWEQIAELFADYDEHLIFESMNEVFDNTYSDPNAAKYANINDYNQIFVDTVRQTGGNNAKRWLLIPGWNTNINYTAGDYGFEIPTDTYKDSSVSGHRIMISVHYYDPWGFAVEESPSKSGYTTTWGTDDEVKAMKDQLLRCYVKFVNKGYPVVIGEYGSIDKNNTESRVKYANELNRAARSMNMVPVYWDNGWNGNNGFGLINRATYAVTQPEIIAGIMSAYEGEPDPAPVIINPITKDEALAVIYSTKADGAKTLVKTTADASMNGATQVRVYFDTASDVSFNQYSNIVLTSDVAGTVSKANVSGNSDITGATNLSADLTLSSAISTGDSVSVSAYTASWANASDYVFLIRQVDFLDADGNVLKTVKKSDGLLGDVNNDGEITTADVGLANSHAKGIRTLTDEQFARADVNGDGQISTADVGRINSHAKGISYLW